LWIQYSAFGLVICALIETVKVSRISNVGERNGYVPVHEMLRTLNLCVCLRYIVHANTCSGVVAQDGVHQTLDNHLWWMFDIFKSGWPDIAVPESVHRMLFRTTGTLIWLDATYLITFRDVPCIALVIRSEPTSTFTIVLLDLLSQ
jgi:hypothetical protein